MVSVGFFIGVEKAPEFVKLGPFPLTPVRSSVSGIPGDFVRFIGFEVPVGLADGVTPMRVSVVPESFGVLPGSIRMIVTMTDKNAKNNSTVNSILFLVVATVAATLVFSSREVMQ